MPRSRSPVNQTLVETAIRHFENDTDLFPPSHLASPSSVPTLDSPFLAWSRSDPRFRGVTWRQLKAFIQLELKFFARLDIEGCMSKAPSLRLALLSVLTDTSEAAAVSIAQDPTELRDAWMSFLRTRLQMVDGKIAEQRASAQHSGGASASSRRSLVDSCARALSAHAKNQMKRHPRGGRKLSNKVSFPGVSSDDNSFSDDDAFASDDALPAKKKCKLLPSPARDDEAIRHLALIHAASGPEKLQPRTVAWIADTFCEGAQHVANMLSRMIIYPVIPIYTLCPHGTWCCDVYFSFFHNLLI